jgi:chorismate mutase
MKNQIKDLRDQIDGLDHEIQDLLLQRWKLAEKISVLKADILLPVFSPEREIEIFSRIDLMPADQTHKHALKEVYSQILNQSRSLGEKVRQR